MTLRARRFIYLSFILIFFLLAPLLVFYTAGYRWNSNHHKIQKIGGLVIRTMPREVRIKVQDIDVVKTTPWRYNNLLPNKYLITINKDGYGTWRKNLTITPGETTFAEHIYLFKNNSSPELLIPEKINFWTYQKKNNLSLLTSDNQLKLYNHRTKQLETLLPLNDKITVGYWTSDGNKLLLKGKSWWIWSLADRNRILKLPDSFKPTLNCRLRPEENNAVYCQDNNNIYEHHLLSRQSKKLLSLPANDQIIDFYIADKLYYLYRGQNDKIFLKISNPLVNLSNLDFLLPKSSRYKFINAQGNEVILLDQDNHFLYILNITNHEENFNKTSLLINDVDKVELNDQGGLLYYNKWEIWTYHQNQKELITRQSQPIKQAFWHPSTNYIGILTDTGLEFIELDRRDSQNSTTISNWQKIKKASLNKEAENIFFLSKEGNLFSLSILDKDVGFGTPNWMP